jgi:hypothetical protein
MPRTFCVALALFAILACGSESKHSTRAHSRAAASAASRRTATKAQKTQRKGAARPDTAQHNPLTNR